MDKFSSASGSPYSWLWRNEKLSDCRLSFLIAPRDSVSSRTNIRAPEHPKLSLSYPAHKVILLSHCDYLQACASFYQDSVDHFIISIREDEVNVADALVRYMYQGVVPDDLDQEELPLLMMLSDRVGAGGCLEACVKELNKLRPGEIMMATLRGLYRLPHTVWESPLCQSLQSAAYGQLMFRFSGLEDILANESRRKELLGLPLQAMLVLIQSDSLQVVSEDVVAVVVTSWMEHYLSLEQEEEHVMSYVNPEDLLELVGGIRLCQLTSSFKNSVLGKLTILQPYLDKLWGVECHSQSTCSSCSPRRSPSRETVVRFLCLDWVVSRSDLEDLVKSAAQSPRGQAKKESDPLHWGGYWWRLRIRCCVMQHFVIHLWYGLCCEVKTEKSVVVPSKMRVLGSIGWASPGRFVDQHRSISGVSLKGSFGRVLRYGIGRDVMDLLGVEGEELHLQGRILRVD